MTERKRRFDVAPEDEPSTKSSAIAVDAAAAVAALRNPTGIVAPLPPLRSILPSVSSSNQTRALLCNHLTFLQQLRQLLQLP